MSSIDAAQAALVAIFAAALPDSQVVPGPVDVTTLRSRVVEVGGESTPIEFEVTSMDGTSGTEKYTLVVTISVSLSGTELATAQALAVDDFRACVTAVWANPNLGVDGLSAMVSGNGELLKSPGAQGRSAAVRFPVEIFTTL